MNTLETAPAPTVGQQRLVRLPSVAISIRQPWAWLIVNGWKNVENRDWRTRFRGPVLIHASKGMTKAEYESCQIFMADFTSLELPPIGDLERGGIVGVATVLDCVDEHPSEWFCGLWGFVVADQRPLPFAALKGSLGFFRAEYPETLLSEANEAGCPDGPAMMNMPQSKISKGDTVSIARWNRTEPPSKRFTDPCVVIDTTSQINCESGLMVQVRDSLGRCSSWMDSNWMEKLLT